MKQETFSKAEMLHHFENLMSENNKGKAKYSGLYRIDEDGKLYKKTIIWKEI